VTIIDGTVPKAASDPGELSRSRRLAQAPPHAEIKKECVTGGEEFLVLLPGADLARTTEFAEQLRAAVAAAPCAGHEVTMSFGAAASAPGETFEYDVVFAEADAALYEAKRSGRNRVCSAAEDRTARAA
jgi:diguanylate cyclase (GGDEF)-like protein